MPTLPKPHVIAIFCADLHFTLEPPPCRRGERNWLDTQAGYLSQLVDLKMRHGGCPIVCAGDVVDRWDAPLELINRLADTMPLMYSIAGQHDTRHHNLADLEKTAYTTLIKTGRIQNIPQNKFYVLGHSGVIIHAFPWGTSILPLDAGKKQRTRTHLHVALAHQYAWMPGKSYPNAPVSGNIKTLLRQLRGYDVAVFGDNHIPWEHLKSSGCRIFNCGGFMRRRSDEINHKPSVGLFYSDGIIDRHYLDISKDVFEVVEETVEAPIETNQLRSFMRKLKQLSGKDTKSGIDFQDSLKLWASQNPGPTAHLLLETLDEVAAK